MEKDPKNICKNLDTAKVAAAYRRCGRPYRRSAKRISVTGVPSVICSSNPSRTNP